MNTAICIFGLSVFLQKDNIPTQRHNTFYTNIITKYK